MKKSLLVTIAALSFAVLSAPVAFAATDAQKEAAKEKWQAMTPEQQAEKKAAMKAKYDAMTPEQQEAVKKRMAARHPQAAAAIADKASAPK